MDYVQFITTIGTAISTIYIIKSSLDKKFDALHNRFNGIENKFDEMNEKMEKKFESQKQETHQVSDRIARIEGEMETIRSMLHALIGSLIGNKTGTEGK